MTFIKSTLAALTLGLTATVAQADLSPSDIAAIDGKSGIRVYSADGDFVGLTNGLRINQDRTRLFLVPRAGSIFRLRSKDVIVTTTTDQLTLQGGNIVLDADTQRLRVKARSSSSDGDGILTILLLNG
ncbi:hypothetical protein [uncultured Tateyamaria sp.]|uniref:hypothetical protein n=1 Tax=uncultured Tateyamaria sp. TaxID=455651 RepID=UPI002602BFB4|nr:hypothetical protein [uncultured Tateyamaria sp.]